MDKNISNNLERFSNAFIPMMHFFHNIASEASKGADFSLAQYRKFNLGLFIFVAALSMNALLGAIMLAGIVGNN